jgi:hypothetical protein
MTEQLLSLAVWMQIGYSELCTRGKKAWAERRDESGIDEAVTKMLWLAVGIVVALAATAFFSAKFDQAKGNVPDPVTP